MTEATAPAVIDAMRALVDQAIDAHSAAGDVLRPLAARAMAGERLTPAERMELAAIGRASDALDAAIQLLAPAAGVRITPIERPIGH
jgi:hypothetical protein